MVFIYDGLEGSRSALLAECSQNKGVEVSGQAMQNVLVQTEQHSAANGTADKVCAGPTGHNLCSDLGNRTKEMTLYLERAQRTIPLLC
jgi:hypothetical protein